MEIYLQRTQEKLKEYYEGVKEIEKLNFELDVLKKNNTRLLEVKDNYSLLNKDIETINNKITTNIEKIISKEMQLSEILEKNARMQCILSMFEDIDKELIELKYKKKYNYTYIQQNLHISKATISRKNLKLISEISQEI